VCPIAHLLRACGQLGTKILLPRALTEAVRSREASWQALRTYLRNRVAGGPQACCGLCGSGWRLECDAEAAAEARHQVPQPAGVGRTRDPMIHPVCLLPTTIARYPQWLSPLHLVLTQVNLRDLFPRVDRGAHPAPVPVHQELIQQVLSTLRSEASLQRAETPESLLSDSRWDRVRSSAPKGSWRAELLRVGIRIETAQEHACPVRELTALGREGLCSASLLHRLVLWLAPSLSTRVAPAESERERDRRDTWSPVRLTRVGVELVVQAQGDGLQKKC
jgi:hypothetical protein